ncbi:hypothetical protein AVEN_194378-1 [Araneus ventricosus]|uniref:Uncharacterized protein n=1 Tax=Araneus ventricosus TaxID=182803 RepID=A0A4Y2A612_ARAVE|nr:hypothetical protein AVEN_194378-1 [Araneus ventricosus]
MDLVILNYGQMRKKTPELAPPLQLPHHTSSRPSLWTLNPMGTEPLSDNKMDISTGIRTPNFEIALHQKEDA